MFPYCCLFSSGILVFFGKARHIGFNFFRCKAKNFQYSVRAQLSNAWGSSWSRCCYNSCALKKFSGCYFLVETRERHFLFLGVIETRVIVGDLWPGIKLVNSIKNQQNFGRVSNNVVPDLIIQILAYCFWARQQFTKIKVLFCRVKAPKFHKECSIKILARELIERRPSKQLSG